MKNVILNNGGSSFPGWTISATTKARIFDNLSRKDAFKYLRSSSSAFIAKKEVRAIVFERYNHECALCGSKEDLQVDHVISVKQCFDKGMIGLCNTESNLQCLCGRCNASKKP